MRLAEYACEERAMGDMQERELWSVAVFRLRESANRIFSLATRVRSQQARGQLLRIYEQLRDEEAKLASLATAVAGEGESSLMPQAAAQCATRALPPTEVCND
jgi:hypothetical protein